MQTKNDTSKPEDSPEQETGEGWPEATCYALLPGLIENLTLWAEEYRGKPVSLSLFRAATILGEISRHSHISQWTVNRKMHCKRKYEIWAGENITEEDAEWATTGKDDRSGLHAERLRAFFAGYISQHNVNVMAPPSRSLKTKKKLIGGCHARLVVLLRYSVRRSSGILCFWCRGSPSSMMRTTSRFRGCIRVRKNQWCIGP